MELDTMTLTPEQAKRLNELGAICTGWMPLGNASPPNYWNLPYGSADVPVSTIPDISLSSPPTDAQIANVWRLRERAMNKGHGIFAARLVVLMERLYDDGRQSFRTMAINASLEQIRNVALEVLCPDEHAEELSRLLEGE